MQNVKNQLGVIKTSKIGYQWLETKNNFDKYTDIRYAIIIE